MSQDKPSRETSMKLTHVVILSIIGMLTTSLSVLVFMPRRQATSQDDLTSNEVEPTSSPVPSTVPKPSSVPNSPILPEPNSTGSVPVHIASAFDKLPPPQMIEIIREYKDTAVVVLLAPNEPCVFFVDGRSVSLLSSERAHLLLPIGGHEVICERSNGQKITQKIHVSQDTKNQLTF